jgi:hypothetical protein
VNAKGIKLSNESSQAFFKSIGSIPTEVKFQENYELCYSGRWEHGARLDTYEFYVNEN